MAAKRSITFPIYATDKASPTMRDVGRTANNMGDNFRKVGAAIGVGLAVAGAAAVKFGIDSVQAFAAAQEAQNKLNFAYEKFPALADVSIDAIRRVNSALALKTRFDDDATASAQAVLAQFGLTGTQLIRLTPLLQDYAARTGKDLTGAAEDLGRALLGQGRALKIIGLDLTDTGTLAGNFDALMAGLAATVGGFAEKDAETAAGKLDILRNRFGEVQEQVGEALMPALDKLLEWVSGPGLVGLIQFADWLAGDGLTAIGNFVDFVVKWKDELLILTGVIGAAILAHTIFNAVAAANPWGAVITALIAVGGWTTWVITNFETAQGWMLDAADNTLIFLASIAMGINGIVTGFINGVISMINVMREPLNAVLRLLNLPEMKIPALVINNSGLQRIINQSIGNIASRTPSGIAGGGGGGVGMRAFADGGIVKPTPGGTRAIIGEAGDAEAVIPLSRSALAAYGLGGGGGDVHIHLSGMYAGDKDSLARTIVQTIRDARRSGGIGDVSFA